MGALEGMWESVLSSHGTVEQLGSRGALKGSNGSGCLYVMDLAQERIGVALAESTRAAWGLLSEEADELHRSDALWVPGDRSRIRHESPILQQPFSALRRGRPIEVRRREDASRLPAVAGVYRAVINPPRRRVWESKKRARMYVGRSGNVRNRLRYIQHHQFLRNFEWGGPDGVKRIEVLIVKSAAGAHVWTTADLDRAEQRHIRRAAEKGYKVLNTTGGGNGPHARRAPEHAHWWQPDPEGHAAGDAAGTDDVSDPLDHDDLVED